MSQDTFINSTAIAGESQHASQSNSAAAEPGDAFDTPARETLARRIRALVEANGWTQAHAGDLCGQSQLRISDIVSGRLVPLSIDSLLKIDKILNYHSKEFVGKERTTENAFQIVEMYEALVNGRPIKSSHALVTVGSKTVRGGEVATSSTGMTIGDMMIARVGDLVRYPDGSESPIVSGAGYASVCDGKPLAIAGSHVENGDLIECSLQSDARIIQYADDESIPGLLEIGYEPTSR